MSEYVYATSKENKYLIPVVGNKFPMLRPATDCSLECYARESFKLNEIINTASQTDIVSRATTLFWPFFLGESRTVQFKNFV